MRYENFNKFYIIEFEHDEEFIELFKRFLLSFNIQSGFFIGSGNFNHVKLSFYDPKIKSGVIKPITKLLSVSYMIGTITSKDLRPIIDCNVVLNDSDFNTIGGKLISGIVETKLEVIVIKFDELIERIYDDELNLFRFLTTKTF